MIMKEEIERETAQVFTHILWLHHCNPVNDELEFLSIFGCKGEKNAHSCHTLKTLEEGRSINV